MPGARCARCSNPRPTHASIRRHPMRLDADEYSFDHDDLTPDERALFSALPRERLGSAALEERVVRALAEQQLLRERQGFVLRTRHVAGLVAAALVLFVGG